MGFTLRLTPELARALTDLAKERGLHRSDLIQAILRQWVTEHEQSEDLSR
jgi:metal-responsive CopG/Arc/MetJ family transcriptional regulator